ncbi:hypothetical protein TNCV_536041 [Trichonephila clavipes]|nr:hypothetical protein TNCV_536041 [Trichonephila clavipes]
MVQNYEAHRQYPDILCGSVGDVDHYVFAYSPTKDFLLVSRSQNDKKAWFQSIVRNPPIHSELKSCIQIVSTIQDQIPLLGLDR